MQRSWVILLTTALVLVPIYVWSPPILELIGETEEISEAAGQSSLLCSYYIYMIITVIKPV